MAVVYERSQIVGRYIVKAKIQKHPPNPKRPDGYKVNFVILDKKTYKRIYLIDNHAPIGYHEHPNPMKPKERIALAINSPFEALNYFRKKVGEICNGR